MTIYPRPFARPPVIFQPLRVERGYKKIILLLWLVLVASLGNALASTPGATENRTWEKSFETLETRLGEPLQTPMAGIRKK